MKKLLKKDVVAIAENDSEYGRCGTCKNYLHAMACGECYRFSRYSFAWREYVANHADEFLKIID